jgi:hypothetical protein
MVSRRKPTTADEQPRQPVEVSRGGLLDEGTPAENPAPSGLSVNVPVNEPPAKPTRKRSPRRRATGAATGAKAEAGETAAPAESRRSDTSAGGDNSEVLTVVQQWTQESRAQSGQLASEILNINALVQSLAQGVEANERRLQSLWQDARESQTQLVQYTAQLNDLNQLGQAVSQQEEEAWARMASVSEGFRQASDRLLERMAEQMLRLEGKVDDMTLRLAALERQLEATQFALQESWADLRSVGVETRAAAEQLEVVQRECQDTTEMLQATRQEIRVAQEEVEATGDDALEAAVQLDEARLRTQDAQDEKEETTAATPANANGNKGRLGLTVDADALVVEVAPGSPAAEAGLLAGDCVTAVDGQPIDKGVDLPAIIAQAETANELTLEIMRGETTQLMTVRLRAETPEV